MAQTSRRDLLRMLVHGGGLALLAGCAPGPRSQARLLRQEQGEARVKPHYIVRIILEGGFDSVLTVDAKDPATAGDIDTGYRADERLQGTRRLYGPLIGGLLRHDDDLCLVHGVIYNTVAHDKGEGMLRAGHQRYGPSVRPFGDAVGEVLPGGGPIPHLHIQTGWSSPAAPALDTPFVPENPLANELPSAGGLLIDATTTALLVSESRQALFETPVWFDELQVVRLEEARQILGSQPEQLAAYEQELLQARHLQRLLSTADRTTSLRASPLGPGLQLAFHALRNNHARSITVRTPQAWLDTHSNNLVLQRARTLPIFQDLGGFVDMLKRERNAFGSLFEQTTIAIVSELGRYPKLNVVRGKDHWPENSWILLGKGVQPGVTVGATDRSFRSVPISYRTGSPQADDRRPLVLDSLFATLFHLAGGELSSHGYARDSVLECILAC
jgi:hypothetical protein